MPIIDLVFLVIVIAFALIGLLRGFLDGIFDMAAPILGIWAAVMFSGALAVKFESMVPFHWLAIVIAFAIIFVIVFLVIKVLEKIFKGIFSAGLFKQLDRILGLVFGLVEGLLVVVMILVVLKIQPWFDVQGLLGGSIFLKVLDPIVNFAVNSFAAALGKASEATSQVISDSIPKLNTSTATSVEK